MLIKMHFYARYNFFQVALKMAPHYIALYLQVSHAIFGKSNGSISKLFHLQMLLDGAASGAAYAGAIADADHSKQF